MKSFILLLLLVTFNSFAGEVVLGFKSYHYDREAQFNETNPTIGYDFDNGLGVLYMHKNSIERQSVVVTYRHQVFESKYISADLRGGIASGYPDEAKYNGDFTYHQKLGSGNFRAVASLDFNVKLTETVSGLISVTPSYVGFGAKVQL
jgi:hypothetical protein